MMAAYPNGNDSKGARVFSKASRSQSGSWHGTAFLVEALILLLIVIACMAVFMQVFGGSLKSGQDDRHLVTATVLASNAAEEFSADPTNVTEAAVTSEGYITEVETTSESRSAGTMYKATITITYEQEVIYTLETSKYVSEVD